MELFKTLEEKHGLPAGLLDAVWATESSRGNNLNNSSAGARGHFQFMPATAKQYGIYGQENDLTASATAAARMYSDLMRQSGGNLDKALAGYNWGSGNVQRKGMQNMPAETRNYIQKVKATMGAPEAPQRRGMPIIGMRGQPAQPRMSRVANNDPFAALRSKYGAPTEQHAAPQQDDPFAALREKYATPEPPPTTSQAAQQPASTQAQAGGYISEKPGFLENAFFGVVRGATDALSPIASGLSKAADWVEGGTKSHDSYKQQIAQERADFERRYGKSGAYTAGQIGGNMLITAPVSAGIGGGVVKAGTAMGLPKLAALGSAIKTGGMAADGMKGVGGMAVRTLGGAINGAITGGMSADPDGARQGAIIGGAMPGVTKVAGVARNKMGKGVGRVIGGVSPEVKDLAIKAQQMGIDIPVDRLTNSKPLNAVASSLEYLPFSGRQGTMARMQSQANRAVARTMGQDSDNLTMAFKTAKKDLGGRFDDYLKTNGAVIDNDIVSSLAAQEQRAKDELGDGAKAVIGKIDDIIAKTGPDGVIDGKAAYNIKRELDLLSKRNQTFAPYARDLRDTLMDAMNKAAGPEKSAEFSKLRQQYGNMKTIEGLIPNGAEGDISLGRLANLRGARNQDLQDVADVSAQFLKTRESPHGSLQRIMQAVTAGGMYVNPWITTGTLAGGRVANSALNSNTLRNLAMNGAQMPSIQSGLLDPRLFYKMAPALSINHRQDPSPSSPSRSRK